MTSTSMPVFMKQLSSGTHDRLILDVEGDVAEHRAAGDIAERADDVGEKGIVLAADGLNSRESPTNVIAAIVDGTLKLSIPTAPPNRARRQPS